MTWKCYRCGAILATEEQYKAHVCNAYEEKYRRKCPKCGGTGKISELFGPTYECPLCKGTGKT